MSTGADAMGVAAWLTPVLIVAVLAGLAPPGVGQRAASAPLGSAAPAERIAPDCDPAEAEKADPLLVEEPDGVCTPKEPDGPGESASPDPAPAPGPGGSQSQPQPQPQLDLSQPAADPPTGLAHPPPEPHPTVGARRRPVPAPDPVQPKRRPAKRTSDAPARERRGRGLAEERRPAEDCRPAAGGRGTAAGSRRSSAEDCRSAEDRRSAGEGRRRSARERSALAHARRTRGHEGAAPASPKRPRVLARRLVRLGARRNARRAVRRLARAIALRAEAMHDRTVPRHPLVRRVVALAHLNRAIGVRGLVRGLKPVKRRLARQVLESRRLMIYPGGRHDIGTGFTDVRVLVLLRYLSSRYREVTVTSLTTGHSFFTASGNVSNHTYGQAVDIAALNGRPILGNQEPGGLTERALHKILLLPRALEPSELISLFELGGPSFALADHADHIHVGY